jgi:hypothetical protein
VFNSAVGNTLSSLYSRPSGLTNNLESKIRERCGINPSQIKVFRDDGLKELGQTAYAKGNEIHLAGNSVDMNSESGERVILHEAAHIVQQGKGGVAGGLNESPAMEREADSVADGGHISAEGFSVPTASDSAAIQGWAPWDKLKRGLSSAGGWISDKAKRAGNAISSAYEGSVLQKGVNGAAAVGNGIARGAVAAGKGIARGVVGAYDGIMNLKDDIHDAKKSAGRWIKGKYEGSGLQRGVNAVKGGLSAAGHWVANKASAGKDWVVDKATAAKNAISDAYEGSGLQRGVNAVKGGLSSAGHWVADKASAAGHWVADKATAAKNAISDAYEGSGLQRGVNAVKGGLSSAGHWVANKARGVKNAISNAYEGSLLQRGVNAVGGGLKTAGGWVVDKAKSVKKWVGDTKEQIQNWWEDTKDSIHAHDDDRYLKHRLKKYGNEFGDAYNSASQEMDNDETLKENLKHRADVKYLAKYNEDDRDYTGDGTVKDDDDDDNESFVDKIKSGIGDKIGNPAENNHEFASNMGALVPNALEPVNNVTDTLDNVDYASRGIKAIAGGSKLGRAASRVSQTAGDWSEAIGDIDPTGGILGDSTGIMSNAVNLAMQAKRKSNLNKLSGDDVTNGITDAGSQKMMLGAKESVSGKNDRDMVSSMGGIVSSSLGLAGDLMGGTPGTAISKIGGFVADNVTDSITSNMKDKENDRMVKNDIFGGEDNYKHFKNKHNTSNHALTKRALRILMQEKTGSRNVNDIAERVRMEQAQTIHRHLGTESGDTGADRLMEALGHRTKESRANLDVDTIQEYVGGEQNLKDMLRHKVELQR